MKFAVKDIIKKTLKPLGFALIFVVLFQQIQTVFQPAFNDSGNAYARVSYFYEEEPSPEVVIIGASQVYCGVNPLIMFRQYGFSSYALASASRGGEVLKLYVDEAIKIQNPNVVVIDAWMLTDLTRNEVNSRKWLDPIPFSVKKMEIVGELFRNNEELNLGIEYDSFLSYAIPLLRYHSRWSELDATAFEKDSKTFRPNYHGAIHYHGCIPLYNANAVKDPYNQYYDSVDFDDKILAKAKGIFDEIVEICAENKTELLIIKVPTPAWRQDYHDVVSGWADEYGIPFLDYNDFLDEVGIDTTTDFRDGNHMNDSGAVKTSNFLGQYLQENYNFPDHRGDPAYAKWDEDWEVYQQDKASYFLPLETDWANYVEKLQNSYYTVYMVARGSIGGHRHPELTELLTGLGLDSNVRDANRTAYVAVIDGGEVIYEHMEDIPLSDKIDVNGHQIELSSESGNYGNLASIKIDGVERFINRRGLGIVVYDNLLEEVVDSVTFDFLGGGTAYRK